MGLYLFFSLQSDFLTSIFYSCFKTIVVFAWNMDSFSFAFFCLLRWAIYTCNRSCVWCIFITKYDGKIAMWMVVMMLLHTLTGCRDWHLPYANGVVAVAGKQGLAIGGPGKWQTLWWIGLWCLRNDFWAKFFNSFLACQILLNVTKRKQNSVRFCRYSKISFFERE